MAEAKSTPESFYVYTHRTATTGEVFYVGKGKGKRAWRMQDRNASWLAVKAQSGCVVCIEAEGLSEPSALALEVLLIAQLRACGTALTNRSDGGEGGGSNPCQEARNLMRDAKLGKKRGTYTAEHRQNISKSLAGRTLTRDAKRKISEATKQGMSAPEVVEKMRAAKQGKKVGPHSEEWNVKISMAHKGMDKPWLRKPRGPLSAEHKRRISETKRQRRQA